LKPSLAISIRDESGNDVYKHDADMLRESSSTIKIPILALTFKRMIEQQISLHSTLTRQDHHSTKGSGILNWTDLMQISLKDLIYTTFVYSDCLATNMLIDFIGGQRKLNSWLETSGFETRLRMPYLTFTDDEQVMPGVGRTTAFEILSLYRQLDGIKVSDETKQLMSFSTSHVNESWLELSLPSKLSGLHHKTGSMINCGPRGETVFNAAGKFKKGTKQYFFGLLSHGWLQTADNQTAPEAMSAAVAIEFYQRIQQHC
jgi:hypothetical protein